MAKTSGERKPAPTPRSVSFTDDHTGKDDSRLYSTEKDEELYKSIAVILRKNDPQRVLLEPALEPFIPSLSKFLKLRVLIIKDCDLLDSIEELKALKKLNVLEVSGAISLAKISDDFFEEFFELQSLHLSGLQITSSPPSISLLKRLYCLIIKNCPLLQDLPNIQELLELEVIDISGALSLQTCFDNSKGEKKDRSKNKNFYLLQKLQLLDFSGSQIERLPLFQDAGANTKLQSLTHLLLRNCRKLRRLPSLKPLTGLQILDLSGTSSLVEMPEM